MKGSTKVLLAVLITAICWCFTLGLIYNVWPMDDGSGSYMTAIGFALTMLWLWWDLDSGQKGETVGPFYIVITHVIEHLPELFTRCKKWIDDNI